MKSEIVIHAAGGAGINVVADICGRLNELGDMFSEYTYNLLDTTVKTIQCYPDLKDRFFKIESTLLSQGELDGMAGERKSPLIVQEIHKAVKVYMDGIKKGDATNKYHVVIASASGGSGSIASTLLIKEMLGKGYTVIPVLVSDSSTLLKVTNTINTIVGLNKIAVSTGVALPIGYFVNNLKGITTPVSEKKVNNDIEKMLTLLGMFTSGTVIDMDNQDMNNFLIPSRYKSFEVKPGLYRLSAKVGVVDDQNTMLVRTIITSNTTDINIAVPLLDNKVGKCLPEHLEILGDDIFPIFMTIEKNTISNTVGGLQKVLEDFESIRVTNSDALDMLSSSIDDDSGLVL